MDACCLYLGCWSVMRHMSKEVLLHPSASVTTFRQLSCHLASSVCFFRQGLALEPKLA